LRPPGTRVGDCPETGSGQAGADTAITYLTVALADAAAAWPARVWRGMRGRRVSQALPGALHG